MAILPLFLAVLLIAVLAAVVSVYADMKARDQMPPVAPPEQEGVWPPPPSSSGRE